MVDRRQGCGMTRGTASWNEWRERRRREAGTLGAGARSPVRRQPRPSDAHDGVFAAGLQPPPITGPFIGPSGRVAAYVLHARRGIWNCERKRKPRLPRRGETKGDEKRKGTQRTNEKRRKRKRNERRKGKEERISLGSTRKQTPLTPLGASAIVVRHATCIVPLSSPVRVRTGQPANQRMSERTRGQRGQVSD